MSSLCRILVVDDDQDSCDLVKAMLHFSNLNYEVSVAHSAADAVSLIAIRSFNLYILDSVLPDMSGIDLCRHIKNNDPVTPVMFLSGMARPVDRENGIKAGADQYFLKPVDLEKLVRAINQLLDENPFSDCEIPLHARGNNRAN